MENSVRTPLTISRRAIHRGQMTEINLEPEGVVTLSGDTRGRRIQALTGNLWVTQLDDPHDYVLRPGEGLTITRPGKVLVGGLTAARFRLLPRV